jgi:hypothetical protein
VTRIIDESRHQLLVAAHSEAAERRRCVFRVEGTGEVSVRVSHGFDGVGSQLVCDDVLLPSVDAFDSVTAAPAGFENAGARTMQSIR